ncbi:MAG: branched-chain amino acid ABC transporter permease [Nitrososphaerota archaeon]|nr:branched-chain amino acid ABC transporter permease [Candidatus Bathyarchaeota archaeon]MDW8022711.1 branched-chain amino acid ABC transporter permease [Nitrososphaerota archaeon]
MLKNKKALLKMIPLFIVIIVLALAPYFLEFYYLSFLNSIFMWIVFAMSWHFFSGLTRYVSLGSAAFIGLSIYIIAKFGHVVPFPVAVLMACGVNFLLALAVGSVTLRLKGIYFAIFTFGLSEVLKNVIKWWEIRVIKTSGTVILVGFDDFTQYYSVLTATIVALSIIFYLRRTKIGLALRMVGENEEAAVHLGVNVSLFKILGFAISVMCMSLAISSFTPRFAFINPDTAFDAEYSFLPAIMPLFGGAGVAYGPIVGTVAIWLLREYLRVTFTQYYKIILGFILVAIVIFIPQGIAGAIEKVRTTKPWRRKGPG